MGTFAEIIKEQNTKIPDGKVKEFEQRIEELFQMGGMMEYDILSMCGKEVITIHKATMHEEGMCFRYNYFEEAFWEDAGYSAKNKCIRSGKIGWRHFYSVLVAAYVLEELYTDGTACTAVDGKLITDKVYTAWINYLFRERFHVKSNDPWKVFEVIHYEYDENSQMLLSDWKNFAQDVCGMTGYFDICAVEKGTEAAIREVSNFDSEEQDTDTIKAVIEIKNILLKYRETSDLSQEEQICLLVDMFRGTQLIDVSVFLIKAIAEIYKQDFWKLWGQVRDAVKQKSAQAKTESDYLSVSTQTFLDISGDDRIVFWTSDNDISFSEELKSWFKELREQFDQVVQEDIEKENALRWILDLMEYANEEYYSIYTFSEFFEETINNLADKRYLALWEMYDRMLHCPDLKKAGEVLFLSKEETQKGLCYYGKKPRHKLKGFWEFMDNAERNNKARVMFRRYMALVANRELREKVFGF